MAFDLNAGLRRSSVRFTASINRIFERYNRPFEDDLLVSMETLTYDTPEGPKQWDKITMKKLRTWKEEVFKHNEGSQRNAETSEQQTSDFESRLSTVHQESPENSCADTSDIGEESDANIVSVRRKCEDIYFQNLYVADGKIQEKVKVDVIVQDCARKIPRWITKSSQCSSKGLHFTLPVQELIGNQAAVCRKKESSNQSFSSRLLQLDFSGVPISPNTITIPRHQPSPELSETYCDNILEECQSGGEECFWSNVTIADLYPAMVQLLKRLMTKQSQRKYLQYMFGHLRHKPWHSRRPKLNVTADKIRGFRPFKLKQALPSICSSRREDIRNQAFGNEKRELCDDKCSINDLPGLVPFSYVDTNEIKMNSSDSSLERHLLFGQGPEVSRQTVAPNVMARMGEMFLVEDELQTSASLKTSKCKEGEKLAYDYYSECRFMTSAASSESTTLHLVKESKTQKIYCPCDTSVLRSSTCSSHGNSTTLTPVANSSFAKASNTLLVNPGKIISGRQIFFQHKDSFSSSMNESHSEMLQKCEDAFEKLYYGLYDKEIQKPLVLTRPVSNSQNLEEKGRLMKSNLSASVRSPVLCDKTFDGIYEQLCGETAPKPSEFQRNSNARKCEGIQMSETVKALVNSPVQAVFAVPRVKRRGNFQNYHLCSTVKRLKNTSEYYVPSTKCQQASHRKIINPQAAGMDFFSTYNGSNPNIFDSHNCRSQDSGFHGSSVKTFLGITGTSMQESSIADAPSAWPKGNEELTAVLKMHTSVTKEYPEN